MWYNIKAWEHMRRVEWGTQTEKRRRCVEGYAVALAFFLMLWGHSGAPPKASS